MSRSNEPIWWSLFSAGGVVAAFLIPVTIVITAIAIPAGWISLEQFHKLAGHPLSRLYVYWIPGANTIPRHISVHSRFGGP